MGKKILMALAAGLLLIGAGCISFETTPPAVNGSSADTNAPAYEPPQPYETVPAPAPAASQPGY